MLHRIRKRSTKVTKGLEDLSHEQRLRKLGLLSLERRLRRDFINPYTYLNGGCKTNTVRLISMVPSERVRGKGQKLEKRRFSLNIRKEIFTESSPDRRSSEQFLTFVENSGETPPALIRLQVSLCHVLRYLRFSVSKIQRYF